jgi:hypothetical protein
MSTIIESLLKFTELAVIPEQRIVCTLENSHRSIQKQMCDLVDNASCRNCYFSLKNKPIISNSLTYHLGTLK